MSTKYASLLKRNWKIETASGTERNGLYSNRNFRYAPYPPPSRCCLLFYYTRACTRARALCKAKQIFSPARRPSRITSELYYLIKRIADRCLARSSGTEIFRAARNAADGRSFIYRGLLGHCNSSVSFSPHRGQLFALLFYLRDYPISRRCIYEFNIA